MDVDEPNSMHASYDNHGAAPPPMRQTMSMPMNYGMMDSDSNVDENTHRLHAFNQPAGNARRSRQQQPSGNMNAGNPNIVGGFSKLIRPTTLSLSDEKDLRNQYFFIQAVHQVVNHPDMQADLKNPKIQEYRFPEMHPKV